MSALADALAAAQSRAVAALGKQYAAGTVDTDHVREQFELMGLTDALDIPRLLASWDVLRAAGATVPGEQASNGKPKDEPATDAQLALVKRLCGEKGQPEPDPPLTKAQAHEVIDTLKAGTYDAGRWSVPF